jgi:DedD protein
MSGERKKLLWISISACAFILIVLAVGFFLLTPKKGGAQAPATIGNSAPPKAQDPQDFLSAPPGAPALEQPRNQDGGMIVVYGDKPSLPATTPGAAANTSGTAAGSAPAAGSSPTAAPLPPPATTPDAAAKDTAAGAAAVKTAAKPAAKGTAGQKPAAAKKPAMLKVDEYWIQAASFTSRGRADELKQSLADKGVAALISVKDITGKSYYRVRIGPYSVKAEADDWLSKIKGQAGCGEAYVSKTVVQKK